MHAFRLGFIGPGGEHTHSLWCVQVVLHGGQNSLQASLIALGERFIVLVTPEKLVDRHVAGEEGKAVNQLEDLLVQATAQPQARDAKRRLVD